jgi:hypothetical protein
MGLTGHVLWVWHHRIAASLADPCLHEMEPVSRIEPLTCR